MTTFAAVDANDQIRFVGDVPRGVACGCFCPTCRSPLVAKQGEKNSWHFAHEAGQERPECLVGSLNLLRRLAVERLAAMPEGLPLPPGTTTVSCFEGWKRFSESLELRWPVNQVRAQSWAPHSGYTQPVARFDLSDGHSSHTIGVFVQIASSAQGLEHEGLAGALVFVCPPPQEGQIKSLQDALDFLVKEGDLLWDKLPDFGGALSRAREAVEHQRQRFILEKEADRLARAAALAEANKRMQEMSRLRSQSEEVQRAAEAIPTNLPGWAVWKKPNSSFFAYGMGPGECWVIMAAEDREGCYIVPIPLAFDGWDECLPPGLASPIPERECYYTPHVVAQLTPWFSPRAKLGSRIDSDARVIEAFAQSLHSD